MLWGEEWPVHLCVSARCSVEELGLEEVLGSSCSCLFCECPRSGAGTEVQGPLLC